ncbi:MAG: OB-fold nucleic acid binding domain-containing protein, partial [Armatimonadota bacterium]
MDNAPAERTQRIEKLQRLQAEGRDPFALQRYSRTHRCKEITVGFSGLEGRTVSLGGRLMAMRRHGKSAFADVHDETGRLQLQARFDVLGEAGYEEFCDLDLGDVIGVEGKVFRTRTGEVTVLAHRVTLLAKALRPLPEKYHGLRDVEQRSRRR